MPKKSQYIPGGHMKSKPTVSIGRASRTPALGHVRSLEEMYRNPQPPAAKRQGKPKPTTFKKP
jgi:hypothetical protein